MGKAGGGRRVAFGRQRASFVNELKDAGELSMERERCGEVVDGTGSDGVSGAGMV